MNKQKTDWDLKLKLVREISEAMAYEYSEYDAMSNNDTPEEVAVNLLDDFITKTLQQQREEIIKEIEGIVGEDEKIELEQPKLFQPNPEPNEYGGYSSVPFYCSLCGESEMTIQDNEVNGKYHCKCSWWTNSCGGKWIKWYDKDYAEKAILDIPSEDNFRNQLRKEIRERLKLC